MNNYICKSIFTLVLGIALIGCSKDSASPSAEVSGNGSGVGGSMARFTVAGDFLYTVSNTNLNVFALNNPSDPAFFHTVSVGLNIETIFSRDPKTLFIGSESGMNIYSLDNPEYPMLLSRTGHIRSYDPVVANEKYAFVTLRSGPNHGTNELQVYDISNLRNPWLMTTYPMTSPRGLGLRNNTLIICDDKLKFYDASNPMNLQEQHTYDVKAYDVIPLPDNLLVIAEDGLYQYKDDGNNLTLLSKIPVSGI
ncbi:MAG: LVIVD repeat-containing protein [Bacteroidia bacterium]